MVLHGMDAEDWGLAKKDLQDLVDAMPLDYSFKNLTSLLDLKFDKPRGLRIGKAPRRGNNNKFLTKAIWLSNNELPNIQHIDQFVDSVLEVPQAIGWLDFAFNQIKDIDEAILSLPNLTILYFHGNAIEDLETVVKLSKLPKLKRLTLHGNPISEEDGYRNYVVHIIPQLINLDFASVLKSEKLAPVPAGAHKKFPDLFPL